jgi:hypothetical protein
MGMGKEEEEEMSILFLSVSLLLLWGRPTVPALVVCCVAL